MSNIHTIFDYQNPQSTGSQSQTQTIVIPPLPKAASNLEERVIEIIKNKNDTKKMLTEFIFAIKDINYSTAISILKEAYKNNIIDHEIKKELNQILEEKIIEQKK